MPNVSTSFSIRRVLTPSREQVATTVVSACPGRRHRSNNQPGKISSRAQLGDRYVPGPGPDFPLQGPLRIAGRDPVLGAHAIGGAAQRVDLGAYQRLDEHLQHRTQQIGLGTLEVLGQELGGVNTVVCVIAWCSFVDSERSCEGSRGDRLTSRRHAHKRAPDVHHVRGL